jgi:signal transduction histidine kinase
MPHLTGPSLPAAENDEAVRLRKTVDRLKRTNAQLRDMERFRTDLTQMIIHDLKAPLAEVIANLSLLEEEPLSSAQRDYLNSTVLGAEELLRRVQNILESYRLETKKKMIRQVLFDPLETIQKVVDGLSTLVSMRSISIRLHSQEGSHYLFADKDLFHRVVLNLLTNAVEHTPGGGTIDVDLEWGTNFRRVQVRVSDSGPGIKKTDRRRIFRKHFTLRRGDAPGHLGLGLPFCKLAVEAHGGKIWIEDSDGSGSCFVFYIPNGLGQYPRKRRSGEFYG